MRVEVIRAWPHRFESVMLELPAGATVREALARCGFEALEPSPATAIHGINATLDTGLGEGDRVEILRPLLMDPKEARRKRAIK